jgi:NhaA family Na+:H+ antiporter
VPRSNRRRQIFDDVGAIVIIALFYTSNISLNALLVVGGCIPILFIMNRCNVTAKSLYIAVGIVMWVATLKSGVHATLAGVVLAMFVPMRDRENPTESPLRVIEHDLHAVVAFLVLPIFAFSNAGINLTRMNPDQVLHNIPIGIALGLLVGKQVGILGSCALAIKSGLADLPKGMTWGGLYGTAALCGIGFTMSLFIGSLAFEETGVDLLFDERLGIIVGSLLSGIVGIAVLNKCLPSKGEPSP